MNHNKNYSFIFNTRKMTEGAIYNIKALDNGFFIYPDDDLNNSKEMSFEKLMFPEFNCKEKILAEIGEEIIKIFNEVAPTVVIRYDEATKKAIDKMAASNSVIFE